MEALVAWLPRIAAALMLLFGLVGFFKPRAFTDAMSIQLNSNMAISEVRTVFGGINIGGGLAALLLNAPLVYIALGCAWFFGLLARFYSMVADGTRFSECRSGIFLDAMMATFFLSGFAFG